MNKHKSKAIKAIRVLICIMVVLIGALFIGNNVAKAWKSKKEARCNLQSVTLDIDGTECTYEAWNDVIPVPKNVDWETVFAEGKIKVVDYTIRANENCTHEGGHDTLEFLLYMNDNIKKYFEYSRVTNSYVYHITDGYWDESDACPGVRMYVDLADNDVESVGIEFGKIYDISYDDATIAGISDKSITIVNAEELPSTYVYGKYEKFPVLEQEGKVFLGWKVVEPEGEPEEDEEDENTPEIIFSKGWLTGDVTMEAVWEVESEENGNIRIDLDTAGFELWIPDYSYGVDSSQIKTDVEVYDEDTDTCLELDRDYVVFVENVTDSGMPDGEKAPKVIVKGIGNYTGILEAELILYKGDPYCYRSYCTVTEGTSLSEVDLSVFEFYDSYYNTVEGTLTWKDLEEGQVPLEDIEVGNEGEYILIFTPNDTEKYNEVDHSVYIRVTKDIADCTVEYDDTYTYTGLGIRPEIIVMDGEAVLEEDEHYEVQYKNNLNAAAKNAENAPTIEIQGIEEYGGSLSLTFAIEKATPIIQTNPTTGKVKEGNALETSSLTSGVALGVDGKALAGTFSWKDANIVPTVADSGVAKYTVVFTPADANYNTVEVKIAVTVEKKTCEHKWGQYVSDNNATCTTDGTKTAVCANGCGKKNTIADTGSKKAHVDANKDGKCDIGGETLTVEVQKITYKIAFNGNGATSGTMKAMSNCVSDTEYRLTVNAFKKTGYTFNGWNTKKDGSGKSYKNKASVKNLTSKNGETVTLYAQWKKTKYTITYKLNGGKNSKSNKASYYYTTKTFKLKNPTRKGYTFKGWYTDKKCTKKITQVKKGTTKNYTLYAKWAKKKYTISYVLNKGKNNKSNKTSYYVTTKTFKLKNPTRKGYTFKGWYSDKKCTKKVTKITKGTAKNIKLYAKWVKKK